MASISDPDRGSQVVAVSIVMTIVSTTALTLRVWSRLISKNSGFWWDDWLAVASLPFALAVIIIVLLWVSDGLGHHTSQLAPTQNALGLRYLYAVQYPYALGISLPKYSAVFFYMRVLKMKSTLYRIAVYIAFGLITVWLLFAFGSAVFQCIPVRKAWLPTIPGHCNNYYDRLLVSATVSIAVDLYIMLLPLPVLWTLHTGRSRKIVLTGFFFCAYCVLIISIGRLVVSVQSNSSFEADFMWETVPLLCWVLSEPAISIFSIRLPNVNYLFQRARHHGVSALCTRREYASKPILNVRLSLTSAQKQGGFERIGNGGTVSLAEDRLMPDRRDAYSVSVSAEHSGEEMGIALGQVHMRQDVNVVEEKRWAPV